MASKTKVDSLVLTGKRIPGWASLNDKGEIIFTPKNTGSGSSNEAKLIFRSKKSAIGSFSVYEYKEKFSIHIALYKGLPIDIQEDLFYDLVCEAVASLNLYLKHQRKGGQQ